MTALVLVVDDLPQNVKLLEVKLTNEYYDVITASNGFEAIEMAKTKNPDIILLDVMMPEMDGFEACRKIKADRDIAHIPVVMVTALSDPSDRVQGLSAGADDFLTKPINEIALFARVKSLVRIKMMMDELSLRGQTGLQMGVNDIQECNSDVAGAKILIVDDDVIQSKHMSEELSNDYTVVMLDEPEKAVDEACRDNYDLVILSTQLCDMDGLRLNSQLRSHEKARHIPILLLIEEGDDRTLEKGLEMGANDYIMTPLDINEMVARVKTQIRRKKYQDALRDNYHQSVSLAVTDGLTGLYNRHFLNAHLQNLFTLSKTSNKPLSIIMMDMDHFKSVNDTYGHNVGDEILKQLAEIILGSIRSSDLATRFGGEEFVVVMPETDIEQGNILAERIRSRVDEHDFKITHEVGMIKKTISIGVAELSDAIGTPTEFIQKSDEALYEAKETGRNKVVLYNG